MIEVRARIIYTCSYLLYIRIIYTCTYILYSFRWTLLYLYQKVTRERKRSRYVYFLKASAMYASFSSSSFFQLNSLMDRVRSRLLLRVFTSSREEGTCACGRSYSKLFSIWQIRGSAISTLNSWRIINIAYLSARLISLSLSHFSATSRGGDTTLKTIILARTFRLNRRMFSLFS